MAAPRDRGESRVETPSEAELPICDAHHHLWERAPNVYLLDDLRADLASGHNVVSTVAIECGYGYRRNGPDEMTASFVKFGCNPAARLPITKGPFVSV